LLIVGLPLVIAGAGWLYYKRQQQAFAHSAETELMAIADLKVTQISRWREERLADAAAALETEIVRSAVRDFLAAPEAPETRSRLLNWMASYRKHGGFSRVVLIDARLQPRLAVPEPESWLGPLGAQFVAEGLKTNQVIVSDLHISAVSGRVNMDIVVPLPDCAPGGGMGGVLLLEIDPQGFLFPLIQSWPTPSPTAETLLVRREGDKVLYLNELRHRTNTALRLRVSLSQSPHLPAARAALGRDGVVHARDYRQEPVLAALREVPNSPWRIVAKRDEVEVNAPLRDAAWTVTSAAAVLMVAGNLGILLLWRNREYRFSLKEIEERKRTEEALRQGAERFRSFAAAAFEGICVHEQGRILDLNDQFAQLFGCQRAELIGTQVLDLVTPESRPRVAQALQTRAEAAYEHLALRKDGSTFVAEVQAKQALWDGKPVRVSALRDITDRQRLQEAIRNKNKELESVIYVSSHDLRSPLVNIQGFSHRLQTGCEQMQRLLLEPETPAALLNAAMPLLQERIFPSLKFILSSVLKMDGLLNGLLRLSRLGRGALKTEILDMNQVAKAAVDTLAFQFQQISARVVLETLPPCAGDATQISQVLSNLLDNALKYRDPVRPLTVCIRGELSGGESIYCVEDNGLGIAPEHQEKVWEIFQRLAPSGEVSGEGLGLAIVRRILDRHNGRVWLKSQPGQGSCFWFALPATAWRGRTDLALN
jgi:PAS domain S-box-containing protein